MNGKYVPVNVISEKGEELWIIDVTNLSVTELVKLRSELLGDPSQTRIQVIDAMIRDETQLMISNSGSKNGYMRTYKKNKKEQKQKMKVKSWRNSNDKHKR